MAPGDGADAAGDGRAADEAGGDGVHLELHTGLSSCGSQTGEHADSGHCGQEAHVDEQQEVHAAGVDTGEDGGLAVATNGVHVATEHGLGQDEVVDEDQHTDDHQHDRGTTLISVTGGSQQVGDEGDDDRGKHNFEDGQAHRLGHQADLGHTGALAQLAPGKADDAQDAEHNGQTIERTPPAKDVGQVVTGNATEFEGGNRHGFADDHGGETTEDQHAGQSGNEARDADDGDPEALPDDRRSGRRPER